MSRTDNDHLPATTRPYQKRKVTIHFDHAAWKKLRQLSVRHIAAPEAYVKRILNHWLADTNPIPLESFNRFYPTTKTHLPEHHVLVSPYPEIYQHYLDNLINTLPPIYSTDGINRRRLIETLVLIYLFDMGGLQ